MRAALLAVIASSSLAGCAARAAVSTVPSAPPPQTVTQQDIQQEFQPDRPDLANGTHIVPIGLLQLEAGGQWAHITAGNDNAGVPFSLRLGLNNWMEARVEGFTDLYEATTGQAGGFNGLSTGAKIAFTPAFAIMPAVQLPVGSQTGTDYLVALITGTDFGDANHVDANYGAAAFASDHGHFLQQWLAVSVNRQVTGRFSPYAEFYWFSRQDPGGPHIASTDVGFIYTVSERFAFDCGADLGLTSGAPRARVFAGLSVIVGEVFGHHGVHERLREAAERHAEQGR
jgi:hypothetical protein